MTRRAGACRMIDIHALHASAPSVRQIAIQSGIGIKRLRRMFRENGLPTAKAKPGRTHDTREQFLARNTHLVRAIQAGGSNYRIALDHRAAFATVAKVRKALAV